MEFLFLVSLILQIIILIFSIVIHEVSHGAMADYLGDPTAKYAGRLTLNPSKHLDLIGSVIVPLFLILTTGRGFGWAKPVPINPYNFRDQKYGSLKVALAGPGVNLAVALVFGLILRFSLGFIPSSLASIFSSIIYLNIILGVFNLLPIPPLDGSHVLFTFLPYSMQKIKIFLTQFGFFILIFLIFFFPWFFQFLIYIVNWIFTIIVGAPLF
ncbi:MAG: site-2 protease family protein [Candidatus Nealsonbacteria bacterium]|nr:MAG: site-2 protease family protein [Candidatus Nealsonbacteria bacterium]